MVNTGRPSRACATCKLRKIKCDEQRPACFRCQKSGWVCPGYSLEKRLAFRHFNPPAARVAQHSSSSVSLGPPTPVEATGSRVIELLPHLTDRATSFFLHHYASGGALVRRPEGVHQYLPQLLLHNSSSSTLERVVAAAGLAALANAGAASSWKSEAYRQYGQALRLLQADLVDPIKSRDDSTLASIMLCGTFEMIADAKGVSMDSFCQHIVAGARCVELRGPGQFHNRASVALFSELRRLIAMTSHHLQEPLPPAVDRWHAWIAPLQDTDMDTWNQFTRLNACIAVVRADIKHNRIRQHADILARLFPIDAMFEEWRSSLPRSWIPKTYKILDEQTNLRSYNGFHDIYRDIWVASTWNNYRMLRILIHETIRISIRSHGDGGHVEELQRASAILDELATGVCNSVGYILGYYGVENRVDDVGPFDEAARPGGYLLIWPLFLSGSLATNCPIRRKWAAAVLWGVGLRMGLKLAMEMSLRLSETNACFTDQMSWLIGEFYPC